MSGYLQTSTANPYGRRPWATRLYTGFENYAFLKQPQNTIIREDVNMRPEIYRPPEMKSGLGDVTIVGGSGRILRRARRRSTLGAILSNGGGALSTLAVRGWYPPQPAPVSQIIVRGPINYGYPPPPPISILPVSMPPPVPQPVASGPGGIIYALPGDATTPGSPFAPPAPGQLPLPAGAVPISSPAAAAAATDAAATPPLTSSFSAWFNSSTWISGVPNGYVAIGGAAVLYMFSRKKR